MMKDSSRRTSTFLWNKFSQKIPEVAEPGVTTKKEMVVPAGQQVHMIKVQSAKNTDVDDSVKKRKIDDSGQNTSQKVYNRACKKFKLQPIKRLHTDLNVAILSLKDQSLGVLGAKALAIALVKNHTCSTVQLDGNDIGINGTMCLAEMLKENVTISDLSISNNKIGSEGLECLLDALKENRFIYSLTLKGNDLGENDAKLVADFIKVNTSLKSFDVSYNCFREKGGEYLQSALAQNKILESLSLSWNHLRLKGAVAICQGLKENKGLRSLDVSWNGFGMEGCEAMAQALIGNSHLKELNLSSNRISHEPLKELIPGIERNSTLSSLSLHGNPLSTEAAMTLLMAIENAPKSRLIYVDINTVSVDGNFELLYDQLKVSRALIIKHGMVLRHDEIRESTGDDVINDEDPLFVLFEYMKQQNLRLKDMYNMLDNGTGKIRRKAINDALISAGLNLSQSNMDKLMKKIDIEKKGYVELKDLTLAQREYTRKMATLKIRRKSSAKLGEKDNVENLRNKIKGLMEERRRSSITGIDPSSEPGSRRTSIKDRLMNFARRRSVQADAIVPVSKDMNDEDALTAGVVNTLFSRRRGSMPVLPSLGGASTSPSFNNFLSPRTPGRKVSIASVTSNSSFNEIIEEDDVD